MFEHRPNLLAVRGFMVAACLALLAGCGAGINTKPAGTFAAAGATSEAPTAPPMAPASLTATPGNAQVSLTWSASSGAASYNVKRSTTSGGPYTQLAAATSPSYTDATVSNGTTYYYVVTAANSGGESANSAQASVTPDPTITTPPVPLGLAATAGNAQVSLTWSASSGAASYNVKRSTTSGGPYTQLAAATSPSYTDATVSNGTTYYYVVTAANSGGESANSAQASVTPDPTITTTPPVPLGLAATAGNAQVSLMWSASNGATSYHVKRATTSGGPYTQVAAPGSPAYADTSVTDGTAYYYVVSALDSAGESANSAEVSALPVAPTPPPTTFGTWINVTPSNVDLTDTLDCGNYGAETMQVDTANPGHMYTYFHCQGLWRSTDYGQTWTGPISTGINGATVSNGAGGITVSPSATPGGVPTIYMSAIRGPALGFWKSVNGGIDWTNSPLTPLPSNRQDVYPPIVDPYNPNHLLMCGHEQDYLIQSFDGGLTWSNVTLASGMLENGGTGYVFFINTGNASTTANTWLWIAQGSGGTYGTWRTSNGGTSWTQVDTNEHGHGSETIYQPDTSGVVYMPGLYSALGWGVLRSTDYGQTWTHVGGTSQETVVVGTPKNVYAMFGYPIGTGQSTTSNFELAAQPATGTWASPPTPSAMSQGPGQIAVINDGTHNILVGAMHNVGLWRYIEP